MLDRTVAPPFHRIDQILIKQPERSLLSNGLKLFTLNSGTQPVLNLELIFRAGKWFENEPGVAFFSSKMLSEGTPDMDSKQIAETFESYGASIDINPGFDFLSISIYCLTRHFVNLVPLIKSIVGSPTFPLSELETMKNIQIQNLKVNNEKTDFVARQIFRKSLYGKDHPYGHSLEQDKIKKIKYEQLQGFFDEFIHGRLYALILSGKVDEDIRKMVDDEFGELELKPQPEENSLTISGNLEELEIDKPDSKQTSLRIGKRCISMHHPDHAGLLIANELLGGFFGSRLMKNIREEKGFTYGIHSSIVNLKNDNFLVIAADVKKESRQEALKEIRKEINTLGNIAVPESELETVKNYMLGQLQASVNSPFALASKFKVLFLNGLTYDYYNTLIETINQITPELITSIAKKHLIASDMVVVAVG